MWDVSGWNGWNGWNGVQDVMNRGPRARESGLCPSLEAFYRGQHVILLRCAHKSLHLPWIMRDDGG